MGALRWLCGAGRQAASWWLPQPIMLPDTWGDCECSGDSNTVAKNGRADFLKEKLARQ